MNTVTFHVENCLDCPRCYTDSIYTADSFEHEEGAYCSVIEDKSKNGFGKNGKHKLIGSDDWHLRDYTKVPDWCPLLNKSGEQDGQEKT